MNDLEKLRKTQLMIALEIKRVCEKYQIEFFLDVGTLLGAIRHKGFIPWDDDMDIGMRKSEYERFCEIAPQELGEQYFLDNFVTNPENPLVFSKVRMKGTLYLEEIGNPKLKHNEIFVDIFPYYYISDDEKIRKLELPQMAILSQALLSKSGYRVWSGKGILKRLKFLPVDLLGVLLSKRKLRKCIDYLYNKYDKTQNMKAQDGLNLLYWYFPESMLCDLSTAQFENIEFPIPRDYDYFLKRVYGDYMKIPPKEKQVTHRIAEVSFGNLFG